MPTTFEPIATTTLGTATSNITFSTIPATYTDLRLIFTGTITTAGPDLTFRINGDTGTNYSWTALFGSGTSAGSNRATSSTNIPITPNSGFSATVPMFASIDIFSYAGSTNKTILISNNNDRNGSGYVERIVGLWRSTSAITSVSVQVTNTLTAGTTATLFGIKAA